MQKLVHKYENDKDVVFLFVNTAETFTQNRAKNISSYLNKNNFTFRVLIDEKLPGASNYQVQGMYGANAIPLKVVIDQQGHIRFRTVGYLGSDELVVEELSAFIEILK
ncbi:hypothetical protein D9M68_788790 [compost metagenome]